ncbi:MAG: DUF554 domain-containing protein [Coriobacteriia bacterium]|nr:DUF554 domain-containing protein [Coriobacteriia bacterium]
MSGVVVNVIAIVVGTAVGLLFGKGIHDRFRSIAFSAIGLSTAIIGASMSLGGLTRMGQTKMGDYAALVLVGSLVAGSLIGELVRIEYWLERFGEWLREVTQRIPWFDSGESGHTLVEGFVTASLLFCVGAMTVLGSIKDGLGDHSVLYLKSLLDGFASVLLATTLGIGVGLSIIPVIVVQGGIALSAQAIQPFMTEAVLASLTCVGGSLILCIGIDLAGIKRLPVGNMLPAIVIAMAAGWLIG